MDPGAVQGVARLVGDNVERVVVGKRHEVLLVLVALLCRGHVLIEDVPGVGKTVLAKAVARSLGCTFKRIQFTPDLLPSDVTGVNVFNQQTSRFEFRPGPVVAQMVLADEINRATPKTQAALLEAMEEAQVTVDGASPRGSLALYNASRAWAALQGRGYVTPDDVKALAEPTLAHRVIVNPAARIKNVDSRVVIADLLARVPVPGAQPVPAPHGTTL